MTPYPPEIENLDRTRRELLDGMNRIGRIRKRGMAEGRRQIETLLHFFHKSSCPSRSSCLLLFLSRLHPLEFQLDSGSHHALTNTLPD